MATMASRSYVALLVSEQTTTCTNMPHHFLSEVSKAVYSRMRVLKAKTPNTICKIKLYPSVRLQNTSLDDRLSPLTFRSTMITSVPYGP